MMSGFGPPLDGVEPPLAGAEPAGAVEEAPFVLDRFIDAGKNACKK